MEAKTRKYRSGTRSKEERIEAIESKQKFHRDCIDKLEEDKQKLLNPAPRVRMKMSDHDKELLNQIKNSGLSLEEVLRKIKG